MMSSVESDKSPPTLHLVKYGKTNSNVACQACSFQKQYQYGTKFNWIMCNQVIAKENK